MRGGQCGNRSARSLCYETKRNKGGLEGGDGTGTQRNEWISEMLGVQREEMAFLTWAFGLLVES